VSRAKFIQKSGTLSSTNQATNPQGITLLWSSTFSRRISVEQRYEVDAVRLPAFASEEAATTENRLPHESQHGTGDAANRRRTKRKSIKPMIARKILAKKTGGISWKSERRSRALNNEPTAPIATFTRANRID